MQEKVFSSRHSTALIEDSAKPVVADSKLHKAKDTLAVLTAALPVIGAIGTLFVWSVANFYVGNVEIQLDKPYKSLSVKVYDHRGQEAAFHTPRFQLMPGDYHLVVTVDEAATQHADTTVRFREQAVVKLQIEGNASEAQAPKLYRKRWWQFWRK
ncbi:MAG TPA: hypothetical protein V6D17_04150 [Candidatus Obscuribacterales bacterium]